MSEVAPENEETPLLPDHVEDPTFSEVNFNDPSWTAVIEGLGVLEQRITATDADTPKDELAELRNLVLVVQQRAAALRKLIDQKFVDAIEAHGPIEIGPFRYIVGIDRSTRCLNTKTTADLLLTATGGDLDRFCEQLVAQPFKPASCRALIPGEDFNRCFEVVVRKSVEGELVERLVKMDTRFQKPKA